MNPAKRALRGLEVSRIEEGHFVPAEKLEELMGISRDRAQYGIEMMNLKKLLEGALRAIGRDVWIRQENSGLRVMTVLEASEYGFRQVELGEQKMDHAYKKMQVCVRRDDLPEDVLASYDRRMHRVARKLLVMSEADYRESD